MVLSWDLPWAVIWFLVLTSTFNVPWFGYHQAYRAVRYSRELGRKSVVILGGFDVCEDEAARGRILKMFPQMGGNAHC